jgi:hypothetical protein
VRGQFSRNEKNDCKKRGKFEHHHRAAYYAKKSRDAREEGNLLECEIYLEMAARITQNEIRRREGGKKPPLPVSYEEVRRALTDPSPLEKIMLSVKEKAQLIRAIAST